ncbi:MAG: hypothetical protein LQ342_007780 [Letrouitia transgressa]|nr:MAG: hypothetical protein LQ342_007780 [Letrouitia transgressa]
MDLDSFQGVDCPSLTPFPRLTGVRSVSSPAEIRTVSVGSSVPVDRLRLVTESLNASTVSAVQAAWAIILSAYTDAQDHVVFGTILPSPAAHALTRISLQSQASEGFRVCDLLSDLATSNDTAVPLRHQSTDATVLIFGHDVSLGNDGEVESPLRQTWTPLARDDYAIKVIVSAGATELLNLKVSYSDSFLNEIGARLMLTQLDDIISWILSKPKNPVREACLAIHPSMASTFNIDREPSMNNESNPRLLHSQFESFAESHPYRLALVFKRNIHPEEHESDVKWTYNILNQKSEELAFYLQNRLGLLTGQVVPICMEKRPELYVAVLGILKAGGAWCPIDPSFPPRRRRDLVARTAAKVLIVAGSEIDTEGVTAIDITTLNGTNGVRTSRADADGTSLAYLIWTSGTTGEPKGVPIHHEAAVASMTALQNTISTACKDGVVRCLQFSQFTFDVFVQDLFFTWGVGGTLISSDRVTMLGSFAELATKTRATHAHLTPAFAASVPRESCPTLEVVTMIGEKLTQSIADDWGQDMWAYNTYGPAETTVVSTCRRFGAPGDLVYSHNIGFPLPSVSILVLQDGCAVMKQGIGELALGGVQLSRGYWKDPSKTSQRFVWNDHYSEYVYMTGDMVRQLYDGSLEFIGRTDDLIKIQGIRIELSEVGFALRKCHPLVEQVEVQYISRQDRPAKVLVAFLAASNLEPNNKADGGIYVGEEAVDICNHALLEAQKSLPDYMIPKVFLVLDSIPRTSSAKTDVNALTRIYESINLGRWEKLLAPENANSPILETWGDEEFEIVRLISGLVGTSPEAMTKINTLPSIGVDSIAATRLVSLLNTKGYPLSVVDVLGSQTLSNLLQNCRKLTDCNSTERFDLKSFNERWSKKVCEYIGMEHVIVSPPLPLQESLLAESMQMPQAYWSNHFFSLPSHVSLAALCEAWIDVARATEALRTGFITCTEVQPDAPEQSFTYLQLLYNEPCLDWDCVEISDVALENQARQRARAISESRQRDRFRRPPWAVTVFTQNDVRTMMVSIHHSIHDEQSLDFMIEDLSQCYQKPGMVPSRRHQLREALEVVMPSPYQIHSDEQFWVEKLEGFSNTIGNKIWPDLTGMGKGMNDRKTGFLSHVQQFKTPYKDLQQRSANIGASSLAPIVRAAWGCLLLAYLETESVVFAETWSSRSQNSILFDVIGPLMTVLPVPFHARESISEHLTEHSKFQRASRDHSSIHPRTVRKILNCGGKEALYPAIFNFLPGFNGESMTGLHPLCTKLDDILGLNVEHPVALNVGQSAKGSLFLDIVASNKIMSQAHLVLIANQIEGIVNLILERPNLSFEKLISALPDELLSKTSVRHNEEVNLSCTREPTYWVDRYADEQPCWVAAQVATSMGEELLDLENWNFAELRNAYCRVAAFLCHLGCSRRVIAVCVDRRLEAYALILGILKSGNTYLPIDEDLPAERKSFLLQDSNAVCLFTTKSFFSSFTNVPDVCNVVRVDKGEHLLEEESNRMVNSSPTASQSTDAAYLLYTSGSTGIPKGVLVSRGNLNSFIESASEFMCYHVQGMKELEGSGKYLGLASRAFDVHLLEMFLPWRHGMATVTAPRVMLLDNLELALRTLNVSHASFVPSLIERTKLDPNALPTLRWVTVGGESISKRIIEIWTSNPRITLVNAYGPTEATIGCCFAKVEPHMNIKNVGCPLGNTVAHVLVAERLQYTLRGVSGELCLTGHLVANGYLNRPDANGFVEDSNFARMYRTGDRVRMMADDTLEFLGRDDTQTKIRGQRLELSEVSEVIREPAARELGLDKVDVTTVIAQHSSLPRPQLVSFVAPTNLISNARKNEVLVIESSDSNFAERIRVHCQEILPSYMVPDHIIRISATPFVTSSGKADVKRLKGVFAEISLSILLSPISSNCLKSSRARELTEAEQKVADIIKSTLRLENIDILHSANIFKLGLDSLSAISLSVSLEQIDYDCNVTSILKNPTLEQLATLPRKRHQYEIKADRLAKTRDKLNSLEERFRSSHPHGFQPGEIAAVRPCLPLQETTVATSLSDKTQAFYVNHVTLKLCLDVDYDKLREAWAVVAARNEIVRTCFQEFDDGFVQVVLNGGRAECLDWKEDTKSRMDDYSNFQLRRRETALDILDKIFWKPPLRLQLYKPSSSAENPKFMITIHHALYDIDSLPMILEDVDRCYQSAALLIRTPFSTMIDHVSSQDQSSSEQYWKNYLKDYRPISIADSYQGHSTLKDKFSTIQKSLTSPISELEKLSSSLQGTLALTVEAVFSLILAQTLRTNDIVFGAVLSGRMIPIENPSTILGPCITTIPQRVKLGIKGSSIRDVLGNAITGFVSCLEYQHTALRHIHRWVGAERPLFDCLFSFVRKHPPSAQSNLWSELDSSMASDMPFAIEFEADPATNDISCNCHFNSNFGSVDDINDLIEKIDLLLGALARGEDPSLQDLGIVHFDTVDTNDAKLSWDNTKWSRNELKLRDLISRICDVDPKDILKGASFFSLGIDSISAIRLSHCLMDIGINCSSTEIMRYSCIGRLAQQIEANMESAVVPTINGSLSDTDGVEKDKWGYSLGKDIKFGSSDGISTIYPCTPLQSSMLTQTLGSDGRLYIHHHAIRLADEIKIAKLKDCWRDLVSKTEILRTSFRLSKTDHSWLAAVHETASINWTESELNVGIDNMIASLAESFMISNESDFGKPPLRITILRGVEFRYLVLSLHHGLYDGDSINPIFQDLASLYDNAKLPYRPPFSVAAQEIFNRTQKAEKFWQYIMDGYENNETPLQSQCDKQVGTEEVEIKLLMNTGIAIALCKHLGVTLQTVALLAFGKSLACARRRRDIVFGHILNGRSLPVTGADLILGPLFNTVPFRLCLDRTYATNRNIALDIQRFSAESQEHQHASLSKIQTAWRQKTGKTDGNLFDTLFVFQRTTPGKSSSLWKPVEHGKILGQTEYPENFEFEQREEKLLVRMVSYAERSNKDQISAWLSNFDQIFRDILEHPNRSVLAFPESLRSVPLTISSSLSEGHSRGIIEPGNDLACIKEVLSEISGIALRDVAPQMTIFSLGLDSIAAIHVAATCRHRGVDLTVADVLQGRSLEGICHRYRVKRHGQAATESIIVTPERRSKATKILKVRDEEVETFLPCLGGQFYHLASWLKSGRNRFEATWAFSCFKRVDELRLAVAWSKLKERHSILRTTYVATASTEVVQVVLKSTVAEDQSFRVLHLEEDQISDARLIFQRAEQPFSLFSPPCLLQLLKSSTCDMLLLKLHHASYDAWTVPCLLSDLGALYQDIKLPPTPQFSTLIDHIIKSVNRADQKVYWLKSLKDCRPTFVQPPPSPSAGIDGRTSRPSTFISQFKSSIPALSTLESSCKSCNLTFPTLILVSFARVLARHTNASTPLFGFYQTARSAAFDSIENISGPCMNVLPLAVRDALARPAADLCQALQQDLAERTRFEQANLVEIGESLEWKGPMFNTVVNILWEKEDRQALLSHGIGEQFVLLDTNEIEMEPDNTTEQKTSKTAIDKLDVDIIAQEHLFFDARRNRNEDVVDLGIKCEGGLADKEEAREYLEAVKEEIGVLLMEIVR